MCPVNPALQIRPKALDAIHSRAVRRDVFAGPVVRRFVKKAQRRQPAVSLMLVGVNDGVLTHVGPNQRQKRGATTVGDNLGDNVATALHHAHDDGFTFAAKHPRFVAAKESLIDFDVLSEAADGVVTIDRAHVFADCVAHAPSRFVGHTKLTLDGLRSDSVTRCAELEHDEEPVTQRRAGALERRASGRVDLITAMLARKGATGLHAVKRRLTVAAAAVVTRAVTSAHQMVEAAFLGREPKLKLAKRGGFGLAHADSVAHGFTCRKGITATNSYRFHVLAQIFPVLPIAAHRAA